MEPDGFREKMRTGSLPAPANKVSESDGQE